MRGSELQSSGTVQMLYGTAPRCPQLCDGEHWSRGRGIGLREGARTEILAMRANVHMEC